MNEMNADHNIDMTIPDFHAASLNGPARVGAELRGVRERLGWKLPDIAARLRIRRIFLEAIEDGNLAALPAPAYAAGFIRSYSEAMGLDPEEILRRFRAEGLTRPKQPVLTFPEPVPDRAVPPGAVVFLVAVIAVGAYFLWYRHSEYELKMAQMVPSVPAKLAPLAVPKAAPPAPAVAPATPSSIARIATAQPQTAPASSTSHTIALSGSASSTGTKMASSQAATASAPSPATPQPQATATATSSQTTTQPGSAAPASQPAAATPANPLVISATAKSWVEVRGQNGSILFSRILNAGDTWPVPDEPGLTMTTGNAGGTVLIRNGVASAPLGNSGVVMHNVPLTPASTSGTAPSGSTQ